MTSTVVPFPAVADLLRKVVHLGGLSAATEQDKEPRPQMLQESHGGLRLPNGM
jgi:hypothetical protein